MKWKEGKKHELLSLAPKRQYRRATPLDSEPSTSLGEKTTKLCSWRTAAPDSFTLWPWKTDTLVADPCRCSSVVAREKRRLERHQYLVDILPVIDIIDSIIRARYSARLERSHGHEHAQPSDEQRSLLGFHHSISF